MKWDIMFADRCFADDCDKEQLKTIFKNMLDLDIDPTAIKIIEHNQTWACNK